MNPWIPGVEGNRYDIAFQKGGTAASGHETPDINSRMTEVNTNTSIGDSRLRMNPDRVIDRKMQANK